MGWQTNQNLHEQGMLINRDAIPTNTEWRIVKSPTLGRRKKNCFFTFC